VTLRLSRVVSGKRVTFAFSGELTRKELTEVAGMIERERSGPIVFDLADLTMASREGIEYLRRAAADGAELVNCPPYISRWIEADEQA
jgi:ABC-type transporter Mla MlaB component